jgi:hypothetical protein
MDRIPTRDTTELLHYKTGIQEFQVHTCTSWSEYLEHVPKMKQMTHASQSHFALIITMMY